MRAAALLLLVAHASAPHGDTCYWAFGARLCQSGCAGAVSVCPVHACSLSLRTEACLCLLHSRLLPVLRRWRLRRPERVSRSVCMRNGRLRLLPYEFTHGVERLLALHMRRRLHDVRRILREQRLQLVLLVLLLVLLVLLLVLLHELRMHLQLGVQLRRVLRCCSELFRLLFRP